MSHLSKSSYFSSYSPKGGSFLKTMKKVEIELYQHPYSTTSTLEVIEVKNKEKTSKIIQAVRDLARQCKWYKYRIGIANMWTGWKY